VAATTPSSTGQYTGRNDAIPSCLQYACLLGMPSSRPDCEWCPYWDLGRVYEV